MPHDPEVAVDEAAEFTQLVDGLRTGNPTAAEEICRRFAPFLRAAVRRQLHPQLRTRFDSLDFVQDVWANFLAIPGDRYTFDTPQALLKFLMQIAQRRVTDAFRSRFENQRDNITREVNPEEFEGGSQPRSSTPTPSLLAIADEEWERLLNRFPIGHRAIIERLREGYTLEDVARISGVSLATVNRIVRRLRDLTGC
jgi:RNA polymerase sigma-70 factor (ECF subfamily)